MSSVMASLMGGLAPADWWALFVRFMLLSMLAVGGAITLAPEMHRYMVSQQGWLTDAQFNASVAIAQASPGPNVLFVAVLGYNAGGLPGAAAALTGVLLPSTVFAIWATRWTHARADWLPIRAFRAGMGPVTIALIAATGWILTVETPGIAHYAVTIAAALLAWKTRVHLLVLIAAGAVLGAAGLL
jgi:chromate transporter